MCKCSKQKMGRFLARISSTHKYTIFLDSYFTFVGTMINKLTLTKQDNAVIWVTTGSMALIQSATCHNYLWLGKRKASILQDTQKSSKILERGKNWLPSGMYVSCSILESSTCTAYKLTETAVLRLEMAF